MNTYEIKADVRSDLIDAFEQFMLTKYINDLIEFKYFESAELAKSYAGFYRIRCLVKDSKTLEEYIISGSRKFRELIDKKFPEGVNLSTTFSEIMKTWDKK